MPRHAYGRLLCAAFAVAPVTGFFWFGCERFLRCMRKHVTFYSVPRIINIPYAGKAFKYINAHDGSGVGVQDISIDE
jgi:hypothetical protein